MPCIHWKPRDPAGSGRWRCHARTTFALLASAVPEVMTAMLSLPTFSRCHLPTSGRSALHGPQVGSVKRSIVGRPLERMASSVCVSPKSPSSLKDGAAVPTGRPGAGAAGAAAAQRRRCPQRAVLLGSFDGIQAQEDATVLSEKMDQDVPNGGNCRDQPDEEKRCNDFEGAQIAHPSQQARTCVTVRKRPTIRAEENNEECHSGQQAVANQSSGTGRLRMNLTEAMTIGRASLRHVVGDAYQRTRPEGGRKEWLPTRRCWSE